MRPTARAINKPKVIVGIDRQWFGVSLALAAVPSAAIHTVVGKIIAAATFLILCAIGGWLYKDEPRFLEIFGAYLRRVYSPQKLLRFPPSLRPSCLYDPGKRLQYQIKDVE